MGYTTDFYGSVTVTPPLNEHEVSYLVDFNRTRRMERNNGPLFVGGTGFCGQGHDDDVTNFNAPPAGQPGLWCQWVPGADDMPISDRWEPLPDSAEQILWDGGEKFYYSPEWMVYLIDHLLSPLATGFVQDHADEDERLKHFTCDHVVNGEIEAQGEDPEDKWLLRVKNNVVTTHQGKVVYQ